MRTPVRAGASLAALFGALAIASPALIEDEGWVTTTYDDPVYGAALPTACGGITGAKYGIVAGRRFTEQECVAITARAYLDHALDIQKCTPPNLPLKTHAAFIRFTVNLGATKTCGSTMMAKARAGDLVGACAEMPKWVYAGGRQFPGLVKRRGRERAMCEEGVREGVPRDVELAFWRSRYMPYDGPPKVGPDGWVRV